MTEIRSISPLVWITRFDESVRAKWLWKREVLTSQDSQRPPSQHGSPTCSQTCKQNGTSIRSQPWLAQLLQQPAWPHPLSAQSISCPVHCNWRKGLCLGFQSLLTKERHSYLGHYLSQIQTLGALDVTFVSISFMSLQLRRSQAVLECGSFQHGFDTYLRRQL